MDFKKALDELEMNSIEIAFDSPAVMELPIGSSKIGGKPDLPADFEWYYYEGKSFDGIVKNRPLSFLAQINCQEVKQYDKDNLLPSSGMLYFFYELETMTWGFDPQDKGSARVFYYSGDVSDLKRTEFPVDLMDEFKLPELAISFTNQKDWPDFEEFIQRHDEVSWDAWEEYDKALGIDEEQEKGAIHKLLGYADLIQGGMLQECEEVTNGVYAGTPDEIERIGPEKMEKFKNDCVQWQLLFQMDSFEVDGYDLSWGDGGRIYYYIRKDDLKNMNFDNCWLILQCY